MFVKKHKMCIIDEKEKIMFDILIIGGGPAGVSAGIYAKRAGRNVAIIEKVAIGGQLNLIGEIENYAGFKSIEGTALANEFYDHTQKFEIPIIYDEIIETSLSGEVKKLKGKKGEYEARSVILALGSNCRELSIEGESRLKGSGVSYCAVCDGRFFKGRDVAVVGSGDSAVSDALYLSSICSKVYVLTKSTLKLHNYTLEEVESKENVTVLKGAISKRIEGKFAVDKLIYESDGEEKSLDVSAVFVAIGRKPETSFLGGQIDENEVGYIKVDSLMQTNIEGVYACGDIVISPIKQVSIAVGQGAIAGNEASKFVLRQIHSK